jgi:uncharacterized protein (TIGR00255 family)
MAIKSMTGFGRGEFENRGRIWTAEVRCVNNRYLDLKMKLPRGYASLEDRIRKKVSENHLRGRVDLFLSVSGDFSDLQKVKVNLALAEGYREALNGLAEEFGLQSVITPQLLASYPDILVREQKDEDLDEVWPMVEQVIDGALGNCDVMRAQEGDALATDLSGRLDSFSKTVDTIEKSIPELLEGRQKTLQERLEKLLGNVGLDPARLAQEVAVMADKTDVTEEIVRLRCHIQQLSLFLDEEGGVGRKIDFLIQEFLREVNTLASKINDAAVAHLTVDLKSELEKMREQIQNIE